MKKALSKINFFQILIVCFVTFMWATCFPLIEMGHRAAPPLKFAAIRSLIAGSVILIPILFINRNWIKDKTFWKHSLYISITFTVFGFGGMFLADSRVSPGIATVLANTQPLIAAVLCYFFLQEKMTTKNLIGLLISFSGIILIASKSFSSDSLQGSFIGTLFILFGAFGTGAGNVFMKRAVKTYSPLVLTGVQFVLGAAILFVASYFYEGNTSINWHPAFFWSLMILAVPGTAVSTVLWFMLLKKIQLNVLNIFSFLTPAFGILIGISFFNEKYTLLDFSGVLLALFGIYLATTSTKTEKYNVIT